MRTVLGSIYMGCLQSADCSREVLTKATAYSCIRGGTGIYDALSKRSEVVDVAFFSPWCVRVCDSSYLSDQRGSYSQ